MAINLVKNKDSLQYAWKEVVDEKSDVNWALFGYDGQTFDLKLIGKGDGGLEEMVEDLNSGKIMYAFCRVIDPKTSLPKLVLINWQGEGAPSDKKGKCANHVQDVKTFFKGAHVTINARTDDDVDPQIVMEQVAKVTGSVYSFKERSGPMQDHKPVGSVYKRTIPGVEINPAERDKFWEKEEAEERRRIEDEHRKAEDLKKRIEEERRQRELKDSQRREEEVKKRTKSISELRAAENALSGTEDEKRKWQKQVEEDAREEAERKQRRDSSRKERTEEVQALISKRTINARAIFEQNTSAGQMSTISGKFNSSSHVSKELPPIKTEATNGTNGNSSPSIDSPPSTSSPPSYQSPLSPGDRSPPPSPAPESSSNSFRAPFVSNGNGNTSSIAPLTNTYTKSLLKENLPKRQESDSEQEEQDWETPANDFAATSSARKEHPESTLASDVDANHFTEGQAHAQLAYADGNIREPQQDEGQQQYLQEQGLTARALYDYEAADDTEISFNPDDIITNIDQVDEGWWQGLAPDGMYGLFPANYVELCE